MTEQSPRTTRGTRAIHDPVFGGHTRRRGLRLVAFAVLLWLAGCRGTGNNGSGEGSAPKSGGLGIFSGGSSGSGGDSDGKGTAKAATRDPLLGGSRIPRQDLPTKPGNDDFGYGSRTDLPADPLLRNPLKPKGNVPRSDEVSTRVPFRPGPEVTNAALAGGSAGEKTNELIIDDRRPSGPASTGVPPRPVEDPKPTIAPTTAIPSGRATGTNTGGVTVESLTEELRRVGARPYAPIRAKNGTYEFRCAVPINDLGAMRSYAATGATPLAAVKNVYEHIRAEKP